MRLIRLLFSYSKVVAVLALLTGLIAGLSNAAILAVINMAIATIPSPPPSLIIAFMGLCLILMMTATLAQYSLAKLSQNIVYQLILRLTRNILDTSYEHLEQIGPSKLMAVLTKDIEAISGASAVVSGLCINLALLFGCLIYLAWLSPIACFILLFFLSVGMYITNWILIQGRNALRQSRDDQDLLFNDFEALTRGIKELKLNVLRRQKYYNDELKPHAATYRDRWIRAMFYFSLSSGVGLILFFIPIGFLIFVLPHWIALSNSVIASLTIVIIFTLTPLRNILQGLPPLNQADISLQKIEDLGLSLLKFTRESNTTPHAPPPWQSIELKQIIHTYHSAEAEHEFALGPLSLRLEPGEILFIIGGNGSGKSTLIKMITGLYQPEAGEIYLNDQPITAKNLDHYRQLFSAIFADFYLFESLIGLESKNLDQQATQYLKQLELDRKVQINNGQLSTTSLSQGQRKRLALLTAYLEDRPIYVFDEWASDQDPVFKKVFYCELLPALKRNGKTVIVISHDDRYFEQGDRLIKLEDGRIIEVAKE